MPQEWNHWQGQTINNRFELQEYLGASQDSAVFLTSLDPAKSKKAAIKLVAWVEGNAEIQLARWNSIKALSHPHVIRHFESGECSLGHNRLLYVVMEYADENLSSLLPTRALTPTEAREMLDPTLDALAYIHEHGFVHGHIKPSNIMAVEERLKISCDGIASSGQPDCDPARQSPYLPPEATGGTLSIAADIWSLGVTVVEALTQKIPAFRSDAEMLASLSALPSPFRKIVEECLRADPRQRCTIADIQKELHPPPLSVDDKIATGTNESPRRRGLFAPIAGAILVTVVLVGLFLFNRSSRRAAPSSQPTQAHVPSPQSSLADGKVSVNETASKSVEPESAGPEPTRTGPDRPGNVTRRVLPEASKNALRTIHGTVRVRVRIYVDPAGNVERARVESGGPSRYFANKSLEAARQWKFDSPVTNNKTVPSEWDVEFQFTSRGSKVREKQTRS
jgi:TonB family protein